MIPYSRRKLSDLNTLSQGKLLENHTLHSGAYLCSPNMAVPPPGKTSSCQERVSFACSCLAYSSPRGRGAPSSPQGRGTPLQKPLRYVPRQRVGFFRRFGLKTGMDFAHFGLVSGMLFKRATGMYERIYCFNST